MNSKVKTAVSSKEVPYYEVEAVCPVCLNKTQHRRIKNGSYIIQEKGRDQFPRQYKWLHRDFQQYHPFFFKFWYCPNCHFTDEYETFLTSGNSPNHSGSAAVKFFKENSGEDPFIQSISNYIQYPVTDLIGVLMLNVLAAYIQDLPPERFKKNSKLFRMLLRISWNYRLLYNDDNKSYNFEEREAELSEYFSLVNQLQSNIVNTLSDVEELNNFFNSKIELEAKNTSVTCWHNYRNEFSQIYSRTTGALDKLIKDIGWFESVGNKCKSEILRSNIHILEQPFREYKSFYEFLDHLKSAWTDLPLTEKEALLQTIKIIQKMIDSGIYADNKIKLFKLHELLITLYLKISDLDSALNKVILLNGKAIQLKEALERKLETLGEPDGENLKALKYVLKRTNEIIKDNNWAREEIENKLFEKYDQKAGELFHLHRDLTPEALENLMIAEGIHPTIIEKYVSALKQEKKKGIFRIFRSTE
jgi:uncharacterized protein (DUF2225 family)